jgi:hypothetical protein
MIDAMRWSDLEKDVLQTREIAVSLPAAANCVALGLTAPSTQ